MPESAADRIDRVVSAHARFAEAVRNLSRSQMPSIRRMLAEAALAAFEDSCRAVGGTQDAEGDLAQMIRNALGLYDETDDLRVSDLANAIRCAAEDWD